MKRMAARYLEKLLAYIIERFLSLILSARVVGKPQSLGFVLTPNPVVNSALIHWRNLDPRRGTGRR